MSDALLLRTREGSPFGRKVRIAALRLGFGDRIQRAEVDPMDANDPIRADNPLGKMPCLVLPDGSTLYDSPVIVEYLDHCAGGGILLPVVFESRMTALREQALADGLADAAVAMMVEPRFRPPDHVSDSWLAHQRGKVTRALAHFESAPPSVDPVTVGAISLACALGYLDWRQPVEWRRECPGLIAWLDAFSARVPEYRQTEQSPVAA